MQHYFDCWVIYKSYLQLVLPFSKNCPYSGKNVFWRENALHDFCVLRVNVGGKDLQGRWSSSKFKGKPSYFCEVLQVVALVLENPPFQPKCFTHHNNLDYPSRCLFSKYLDYLKGTEIFADRNFPEANSRAWLV